MHSRKPAAILTWVFANIDIGGTSILLHIVHFLDPLGQILGLYGYILMAFMIPTVIAFLVTFVVAQLAYFFWWV